MSAWLRGGIDYIDMWIEFQMRLADQPGCVIAIAEGTDVVHERAFGVADVGTGERLTERHRFRVASHSKTFTAAGILKLKEQGHLRLDDAAGAYLTGLHPAIAAVTIGQLLSHAAGLSRDTADTGYFVDRRPFPSDNELLQQLRMPPPISAGLRAKYSNLAYGLLGLVIEAIVKVSYETWITREIIEPAGLMETTSDLPPDADVAVARGHTARLPLGQRAVIPGNNGTFAYAPVTGFTSTASDLARFFAQLAPDAVRSVLTSDSRRDMTRPHRLDRDSTSGLSFGLGVAGGVLSGWDYFGHIGLLQGFFTRTAVLPEPGVTITVLTNAIDGPAQPWLDGIGHILRRFHDGGIPTGANADWAGRWWSLFGPVDLVPLGSKVFAFNPTLQPPFSEASEIVLTDADHGSVVRAPAIGRFGEAALRVRNPHGDVIAIRIGDSGFVAEEAVTTAIRRSYG